MTVKQSLLWGFQQLKREKINSAPLDAELLLLEALKGKKRPLDRLWLSAHSEYILTKLQIAKYKGFLSRRAQHEPLAYITHHKEFYGRDFYVNKNVLIPRPETEILIEAIAQNIQKEKINPEKTIFIDIGTGSGCIPITISKLFKFSKIYASDVSDKALDVARLNAKRHNEAKKIKFIKGSLLAPLAKKSEIKSAAHLVISANLPYIKSTDIKTLPQSVKKYEPAMALDGGKTGIGLIAKLLSEINSFAAHSSKAADIRIFLEIGAGQKKIIAKEMNKYFKRAEKTFIKDLSGKNRVISVAINPYFC